MNRNTVETIKQKLSIESVVGSYIKLEKAGKNLRARCPFHNEKTPSFTVTPERGIFYCYGCHKGGDIFNFVQEIENVSFFDALKSLAEKAGVNLEQGDQEKLSKTSVQRTIMDDAAKFYEVGLRTNKPVVEYLLTRKLTKETMVAFRIGYAEKGWARVYEYLKKKNYSDTDILATGLCILGKQGCYDRFRERIMFPIADSQGRIIAFTGRVMPETEEANRPVGKYINSPETDLYHKSSVLFAFDKAKASIHTEDFVIVVEGQMDCIMSHQAGVTNVVALSGTAATNEHMTQLKRFTDKIVICLDADNAGLVAAQKTAIVAYNHDMHVAVLDIGNNKDPADLIAEDPAYWKDIVEHRKDMISFRLNKMKEQGALQDKKSIAEKELFPLLAHIQSQIALDDKLQEIAHAFEMSSTEPIRKEFEKYFNQHPRHQDTDAERSTIKEKQSSLVLQIAILDRLLELPNDSLVEHDIPPVSSQEEAKMLSELDRQLGSFPQERASYERLRKRLLVHYEIESLEKQKQQLDKHLMQDPHNTDHLKKIHELLRHRDQLIHQVTNLF